MMDHSKWRSPVMSNSTVGMTLVINLRKMRRAKCDSTFCLFSRIASAMVLRTLACLQGCTVGIMRLGMNSNFSTVRVLSRYSFWMSSLIWSLVRGLSSASVALKNMRGVWQYSSQAMYMLQYLKSSSFSSSSFASCECRIITSSPSSPVIFSSSPAGAALTLRLHNTFSRIKNCLDSSRYLEAYWGLEEAIHFQPAQISVSLSPALRNSSGESCPFYSN